MEKILQQILNELKEIKGNQTIMNTQLEEHNNILSSLQKASEFHKSDIDNITHQIATMSGEMKNNFKEIIETNKSLLEMYGQHEAEIRTLKRRPV